MNEGLVGYILGTLRPHARARIERQLAEDGALREELERISRALGRPDAAGDEEPPAGLAARTVEFVMRSPRPEPWVAGTSGSWRLTDLAVAASILAMISMAVLPGLNRSRHQRALAECGNNLRAIAVAMEGYAEKHGKYLPFPGAAGPLARMGLCAPLLLEAGFVSDPATFVCPGAIEEDRRAPRLTRIRGALDDVNRMSRLVPSLGGSYAFPLGVRQTGTYHAPRLDRTPGRLLAVDRPIPAGQGSGAHSNSLNHAGCGQNAVYCDGHLEFLGSPDAGPLRDNIYENQDHLIGPSVNWDDPVLALPEAADSEP